MWAKIKAWVVAIWKKYWKWILAAAAVLIVGFWLGWKFAVLIGGAFTLGSAGKNSVVQSVKEDVKGVEARQEDRKARANKIKDEVNK